MELFAALIFGVLLFWTASNRPRRWATSSPLTTSPEAPQRRVFLVPEGWQPGSGPVVVLTDDGSLTFGYGR